MAEVTEQDPPPQSAPVGPIVAGAGRYYRMARYLMTFILLAYGAWSIYDGFVSWPHWTVKHPNEMPKTALDIKLNQGLGILLPPLAVLVLVRALYKSRGEYRLENGVVYVPGHPPVPLDKILSVNREAWDRKGIASVKYDLHEPTVRGKAGGPVSYQAVAKAQRGTFTLDDFVYQREPTDQIFKAIETSLLKALAAKPPIQPVVTKIPPRPRMGSNM